MPKATGLSKEQRAAMMGDSEDGSEPIDLPASSAPAYVPEPAVVTPAPVAQDAQALISALVSALSQSNAANADAIREATLSARNPMPETYLSGGYPGKSVFSHPDGDLAHPRTVLAHPMFLGVFTEKGQVIPAFEILEHSCTERERVLLSQLKPGTYPVERNDGVTRPCRVVMQEDEMGQPIRLVIAVPQTWLSKEQQAQMPSQTALLKQLAASAA